MKKNLLFLGIAILVLFLAACGEKEPKNNTASNETNSLDPLKVDLQVPEHGEKNKSIELKATVKQSGESVNDASDVQYEVWKENAKEDSEMIEADNKKDGIYTANYKFKEDVVYIVQVHVTARQQHQMPTAKISIGNATSGKEANVNDHHGDEHPSSDFSMHFKQPEIKKGTASPLMVHLENKSKPLEKATVRFEISKENEKKHDWVDAKETKAGQYEAEYTFKNSGKYTVQVHVENDQGLHEHEQHILTVE